MARQAIKWENGFANHMIWYDKGWKSEIDIEHLKLSNKKTSKLD